MAIDKKRNEGLGDDAPHPWLVALLSPPHLNFFYLTMKNWKLVLLLGLVAVAAILALRSQPSDAANKLQEWPSYGGNLENTHFSPLKQINRDNVKQLDVAWTYDTGDASNGSQMQCNPLVVNGVLYGTSPKTRVFALDATTGKETLEL